ncbi:MAG: ABC transporter ATP-binding protein [Rhizobiaceae bacterium]
MSLPGHNTTLQSSGEIVAVIRRVFAENGRAYVGAYVLAAFFLLTVAATTAFSAWIMRDVIDEVFYARRTDLIALICGSIVVAFALRGFAMYAQAVLLAKIGNNLVARYQKRIFEHLLALDMGFFSDTRSGYLAAQIAQNVGGIRDLLNITLTSIARDMVGLVALVAVMIVQDPILSAIALLVAPPLAYSVAYLMRRLRDVTRQSVEINSRLLGAFQETIQGVSVVKAFTMESQLARRVATLIEDAEAKNNKIARVSERVGPVAEMLAGFAVAGVIAYAGLRAAGADQPPGTVFAFVTALLLAYDPARRLARVQVGLERSLVNARMIYELLDTVPRQADAPGAHRLEVAMGRVAFDDVSFAYVDGTPVLDRVSFVAEAGRMTAIVGGSGAGKSTLVALLERFYDVDAGRIAIDGQDIALVSKASLRASMAYVSQQPYLFEGTIRDNIRYGREDATDAEIEAAAKHAEAHDFILRQPLGYDTPIGENGATLSGGQRQRISIARAIVRNARILILDEATSALDNESEAKVQQAVSDVMEGRTSIVIAHRLSTVMSADKIVVLEFGRVVEQGNHRTLLARKNGVYARYYNMQDNRGLGLADDVDGEPPQPVTGRTQSAL